MKGSERVDHHLGELAIGLLVCSAAEDLGHSVADYHALAFAP